MDSGTRHYHLYVGTTNGCVADITFSVSPETTEVNIEMETLIQGHGSEITGLSATKNHFITCGLDKTIIYWDGLNHKAKWLESVRSPLTCVTLSHDGSKFAAGSSDGFLYYTDIEERSLVRIKVVDSTITSLTFNNTDNTLAIATQNTILYCDNLEALPDNLNFVTLEGHVSHVSHMDFATDGIHLRSNTIDLELLYWNNTEQITDTDQIDELEFESQNVTLSFETIGIWPQKADGTDINGCTRYKDTLFVGDDFGRLRIYKYPVIQGEAGSVELMGHADHVKHVQPMVDGQIVSSGGREVSLLQWIQN